MKFKDRVKLFLGEASDIKVKKVKDWDEIRGVSADMSDKELKQLGYRNTNWDDDIAEKQMRGKLQDAVKGMDLPVYDWKRVTKSNIDENAKNYAQVMLDGRKSTPSDKDYEKYEEQYKDLMNNNKQLPKSFWQKLVKLHKKTGNINSKQGKNAVALIYKKAGVKK